MGTSYVKEAPGGMPLHRRDQSRSTGLLEEGFKPFRDASRTVHPRRGIEEHAMVV